MSLYNYSMEYVSCQENLIRAVSAGKLQDDQAADFHSYISCKMKRPGCRIAAA